MSRSTSATMSRNVSPKGGTIRRSHLIVRARNNATVSSMKAKAGGEGGGATPGEDEVGDEGRTVIDNICTLPLTPSNTIIIGGLSTLRMGIRCIKINTYLLKANMISHSQCIDNTYLLKASISLKASIKINTITECNNSININTNTECNNNTNTEYNSSINININTEEYNNSINISKECSNSINISSGCSININLSLKNSSNRAMTEIR